LNYLAPALICAAIGFVTNWLAIKMLFWPKKPILIFGRKLPMTPGLLVRRKGEFSRAIAVIAEREFADHKHLCKVALQMSSEGRIKKALQGVPIISGLWILYCRKFNTVEMTAHVEMFAKWLTDQGLIEELVEKRINEMPISEVEAMTLRVSGREQRAITWVGAVLGFFVGLVQSIAAALWG